MQWCAKLTNQIEEKQAEQDIVDRVPELRQLHTDIDNATHKLESAIQKYNQAEINLNAAVKNIDDKVDTINTHIDKVIEETSNKLTITIHATDADMHRIKGMFDKERKWVTEQMFQNIVDANKAYAEARKAARKNYEEFDGIWLGRYMQWVGGFFFLKGIVTVVAMICTLVGK